MQVIPRRLGWGAVAVSFVGVMMVFAHGGFLGASYFPSSICGILSHAMVGVRSIFSHSTINFGFR